MTLQALMEHFFELYGLRNRIFLSGLRKRIDFLNLAIADLQDAVRKEVGQEKLKIALARVVSRIFCIAENFINLPFVKAMARKYPLGHCSYCQKWPCQCPERRPEVLIRSSAHNEQMLWSLKEWCLHFDRLYGERNRTKGIENILNRLFKEVSELLTLQMSASHNLPVSQNVTEPQRIKSSLHQIVEEFAFELADALAWTIAVANLLRIDLEKAVLDRYGDGCWCCKKKPCDCMNFSYAPVDWSGV